MYRAIDEGEDSVLITTDEGGQIVGFIAGCTGMRPILKRMLVHWPSLVIAVVPILFSPIRVWRVLELMWYSVMQKSDDSGPKAELLALGVDAHWRKCGHANLLYQNLCSFFRQRNVQEFKIVVGAELHVAHKFYVRMGATRIGSVIVHGNKVSQLYSHQLLPSSTST